MDDLFVNNLFVSYDKTPVLWDLSFSVPEGSLAAIIGPNGSGKTTLVKTLVGLIQPHKGSVSFWGEKFDDVRLKVAYVPQKESVDWSFPLSVEDFVIMGRYGKIGYFRRPSALDWEKAEKALAEVGMEEYAKSPISELSGGQKQRLFLARALVQEPEFFILDEPFQGIDMASCHLMWELFKKIQRAKKTILIVHHDLFEVKNYFSWAILLNRRVIKAGIIEEVFKAEFLAMAYGRNYDILEEAMKKAGAFDR